MQNLLYFITRYYSFFVFLLLESISYNLIVRYNPHQQSVYNHSIDVWTSAIDQKISTVKNYFQLQHIADSLIEDNARLVAAYHNLSKALGDRKSDTLLSDSTYALLGARVLNNSLFKRHNTFTVNKGQNDGVEQGLGVIATQGVAGIVQSTSPHFSVVMSLLNPSIRISTKIKNKPYFGTLHWDGGDVQHIGFYDIPKYAELHRGDTVYTSGYSSIFPPDIPVGAIEEFHVREGEDVYDITVRMFVQFSALEYTYVVINKNREEIQALEKTVR